jgi:predicted metal-dependent HD superfamily phosphohydrolase
MFSELDAVKDEIENFPVLSFSVFYHDVIYDASSKSNEEKSAEFAAVRLKRLHVDSYFIQKVSEQILPPNRITYLKTAIPIIFGC